MIPTSAPLVLVDLDNTLVDRAAAFRLWAEEFAARWGLGAAAVPALIDLDADGMLPKDQFFAEVAEQHGIRESVENLWASYRERHPQFMRCEPDTVHALRRLAGAGWRISVVTNGHAELQRSTLAHTGIDALVHGWSISAADGVRKPDPRHFEIAAERAGVSAPLSGWMVGDSATADIVGGRAAGLRTIWIDRGRTWPAELSPPDAIAGTVAQAADRILAGE